MSKQSQGYDYKVLKLHKITPCVKETNIGYYFTLNQRNTTKTFT